MLIKLLNVYVDDTDDKLIIDGYNATHHFSRIIRNSKVNFGVHRYSDNASGRIFDRITIDFSQETPTVKKPEIVKLFDDSNAKVELALNKKAKEFEKERELYKESKTLLENKILELEQKITALEEVDVEKKRGRPAKKTEDLV